MTKSYYKVIDGERYDRHMIEIAAESVAGKGDGRISVDDAKKLYEAIIDGNKITQIEEKTLVYIQENFKFTDAANKWLSRELEIWKSQKKPGKKPSSKVKTAKKPSYSPAASVHIVPKKNPVKRDIEEPEQKPIDSPATIIYETKKQIPEKEEIKEAEKTQAPPAKPVPASPSSGIWKGLAFLFLLNLKTMPSGHGQGERLCHLHYH